jgi:DNA-binding Lrp family transcriptional regulator
MYVWVSLERQVEETLKVFERRIADVPEVMSCYLMTGEADTCCASWCPTCLATSGSCWTC